MIKGRGKTPFPLWEAISAHDRFGLKTLFYLFLIISVLWTVFRTDGFKSATAASSLAINLDPLPLPAPDTPKPVAITISGSTTLPSRVRVIANSIPYGETWTGENNRFTFENVMLRSSGINVEVQADAFELWKSFLGFQWKTKSNARKLINEAWPTQTPSPATVPPSNQIQPSPTPPPSESPISKRKVMAYVSYRRLKINLEVTLPNNDPRIVAFVNHQLTLPQFVQRSLNNFMINQVPIQDKFRNAAYRTEMTAVNTTVKAESNRKYDPFLLSLDEGITINPYWNPVENSDDSFTLDVKDYTLEDLNPPPTSWTNEGATWTGKRADIGEQGIQVKVKHNLLDDPALFFRWFQLSPYEIYPRWSYSFIAIILSLLVAFPVIWTSTILRRRAKEAKEQQLATTGDGQSFPSSRHFCRWLIALSLIAPLIYAIYAQVDYLQIHKKLESYGQARGYSTFNELKKDDLRVLMVSALVIFLLASLLWLISLTIRRRAFRYWLLIIFRGLHDAAAICLSIMILMAAVLLVLPCNLVGLHQSLAAIVILLLVALTMVQFWRLRRAYPQELSLHSNRHVIFLIALLLLIAAAYLAYPYYHQLPDSSIEKIYNPAIRDAQAFLSLIRDALPYALLPVLIILLRQPNKSEPVDDFKLGQILFAGYVVGTAPNVFLIPVPFILAYWAYKKFLVASADQRVVIDGIKSVVFEGEKRKSQLEKVLETKTFKYYQEFLSDYGKDEVDDVTKLSAYDVAKQSVKEHIANQEVKLKENDANSPKAKDYLLSVGINKDNWENAKWAAVRGLIIAAPFLLLYTWELAQRNFGSPQSYLWIRVIGPLLAFTAYWLVSGFFFGYFFAYIRGATGLKKGAYISAVVVGCLLISWLISLHSPLAILLRVAQTVLFFTLLGAWADYRIFSRTLGANFNWATFVQFEEVSSLTTLASAVLASLGVAITSMTTTGFTNIITQLITMSAHQSPLLPPQ